MEPRPTSRGGSRWWGARWPKHDRSGMSLARTLPGRNRPCDKWLRRIVGQRPLCPVNSCVHAPVIEVDVGCPYRNRFTKPTGHGAGASLEFPTHVAKPKWLPRGAIRSSQSTLSTGESIAAMRVARLGSCIRGAPGVASDWVRHGSITPKSALRIN